ncbi:MAG: competence/damage-inducible protein A [Acetatifactor sp.]|nr:competence/damage-inducible protein A [Acetatifactor sp.]
MTVEMIFVGTELLLGNIVNTNAAYLSEKCAAMGLSCYFQTVVGDNAERLSLVLKTAMKRADIILLSGGLGPTEDDLTKETAAKVCGKKLVMHEISKQAIQEYFAKKGITPTDNNWKQAMLPEGCIVLDNHNGTAPGVIIETDKTKVVLLPGPPNELCPMFEESVIPYFEKLTEQVICSQTVKICGVGESQAETMIKDMIDTQTNPTIATYAKTGEVHIRVTAAAEDKKAAQKLIKPVVKELKNRFGNSIYTTDDSITLEQAVVDLVKANEFTIACAESCTGGLVAARLVNVPGVSEVFKYGVTTYSNKAKRKVLGIKKPVLQKHSAVSYQVAEEMAEGIADFAKADVALSVTGLAGPDGEGDKPAGLVYIGCCVKGETVVEEYHFSGNRRKIRESATAAALILARRCLLEYMSKVTFGK